MDRHILDRLREKMLDRGSVRSMPENVIQYSYILNTWGTNAIEGNTLTLGEVTKVIESGISVPDRPVRDLMETIQHRAALAEVVSGKIFNISMKSALDLHNIIFHGILIDAGQWRNVNVRISGSKYSPPRVEKILSMLHTWEKHYIEMEMNRMDIFSQAAEMHYSFESIHPFSDGNGRVGRLLLNIHFLKHNWGFINILPHERSPYLDALEISHENGVTKLKEFLEINMARSLIFMLDMIGSEEDKLLTLKEATKVSGTDYSSKYLSLRINQGELPGIRLNSMWKTSPAAIRLYQEIKGKE